MKTGARVALGIGAGYVFGRTRKMRVAMIVAAASATGIIATAPREVVQRALQRTLADPEVNKIATSVRGDLAGAARSAAVTAATNRIEALNQRLREVEPAHGDGSEPPEPDVDEADTEPAEPEEAEPEEAEAEPEEAEAEAEEPAAAEAEPEPKPKRTPSRTRSTSTARRTRSSGGSTTNRAPVRRTRR